jgi:hypothetical protein
VGWRIVLVQNPPVSPSFWSFHSHTFPQFGQDFSLMMLIYHLAAGYPLCCRNTVGIKETINIALNFERLMCAFFGLGDDVVFHSTDCGLVSGSYVSKPQLVIEKFSLRISSV